jgi:hydroxyacylglutathione hydrolase
VTCREYLADAEANGLTIERVIETHFHADFLSGHLELAEATGAVISYGDAAAGKVGSRSSRWPTASGSSLGRRWSSRSGHPRSHARVDLGGGLRAWPDEVPYGVLTGDTLFIGDVGRPDLLSSVGVTADELARQLYHSLTTSSSRCPTTPRCTPPTVPVRRAARTCRPRR